MRGKFLGLILNAISQSLKLDSDDETNSYNITHSNIVTEVANITSQLIGGFEEPFQQSTIQGG
jgi:hypothetical protein